MPKGSGLWLNNAEKGKDIDFVHFRPSMSWEVTTQDNWEMGVSAAGGMH